MFFGSPAPRSVLILSTITALILARVSGALSRSLIAAGPSESAHRGNNAAMPVLEAVYGY